MTTVVYALLPQPCGPPQFERSWSLHLDGRLSRAELDAVVDELDAVARAHFPNPLVFGLLFGLFFTLLLAGWLGLIFAVTLRPGGSALGAILGVTLGGSTVFAVLIFAFIAYAFARRARVRGYFVEHLDRLNATYNARGVNFRLSGGSSFATAHTHYGYGAHYGGAHPSALAIVLCVEVAPVAGAQAGPTLIAVPVSSPSQPLLGDDPNTGYGVL